MGIQAYIDYSFNQFTYNLDVLDIGLRLAN